MIKYFLTLSGIVLLVLGCSNTEVDVGNNDKLPEFQEITDGEGEAKELGDSKEGEVTAASQNSPEAKTSQPASPTLASTKPAPKAVIVVKPKNDDPIWGGCYVEGADYPAALAPLCTKLPELVKDQYGTAVTELCEKKVHLDWFCREGGNLAKPFLRRAILAETGARDPGRDFYYLAMRAMTYPATQLKYAGLLKLAYTDTAAYAAKFAMPKEVKLIPDGNGVVSTADGESLGYRFTTTVAPTQFDGRVLIWQPVEKVTYIFNFAAKNLQVMNKRAGLAIIRELGDGREHVVVFDERSVPDMGLHAQFRVKMRSLDAQDIKTRLENMERAK